MRLSQKVLKTMKKAILNFFARLFAKASCSHDTGRVSFSPSGIPNGYRCDVCTKWVAETEGEYEQLIVCEKCDRHIGFAANIFAAVRCKGCNFK